MESTCLHCGKSIHLVDVEDPIKGLSLPLKVWKHVDTGNAACEITFATPANIP